MRIAENTSRSVQEKFELIKGLFSPQDASDLISAFIQEKINYHKMRNYRNTIHHEECDEWSLARIAELSEDKEAILSLIEKAREQGKNISVSSRITLEII